MTPIVVGHGWLMIVIGAAWPADAEVALKRDKFLSPQYVVSYGNVPCDVRARACFYASVMYPGLRMVGSLEDLRANLLESWRRDRARKA